MPLRDVLGMKGTKFGCGMGFCGACTVHLDGKPVRSCITPVSATVGKRITTIETIVSTAVDRRVQNAWSELDVPQCGYCQSGQVLARAQRAAADTAGLPLEKVTVDGAIDPPYALQNVLIDYVRHEPPDIPTVFWRGVGPTHNIPCFKDRAEINFH